MYRTFTGGERNKQDKSKFHGIRDSAGTSLAAQWIRLCIPNARGPGSIPGWGTRSHMHATTKSLHATTKEPVCCN